LWLLLLVVVVVVVVVMAEVGGFDKSKRDEKKSRRKCTHNKQRLATTDTVPLYYNTPLPFLQYNDRHRPCIS
jgi:hypothetical protein